VSLPWLAPWGNHVFRCSWGRLKKFSGLRGGEAITKNFKGHSGNIRKVRLKHARSAPDKKKNEKKGKARTVRPKLLLPLPLVTPKNETCPLSTSRKHIEKERDPGPEGAKSDPEAFANCAGKELFLKS